MRRYRRRVRRLPDTIAGRSAPPGDDGPVPAAAWPARAWLVAVLTDASGRHLYTTMTQDLAFLCHRARSPFGDGYAAVHGLTRLVLTERYACRHTAAARVSRIRAWPVAERRRLIGEANPGWTDLAPAELRPAPAELRCEEPHGDG